MAADIGQIKAELEALKGRIAAVRKEGVLHGAARQRAAELELEHARLSQRAEERGSAPPGRAVGQLAADVNILKASFDRWLAGVDRKSES